MVLYTIKNIAYKNIFKIIQFSGINNYIKLQTNNVLEKQH